jgi:hypothetical protein
VVDSCAHSNEPSGSINVGNFLTSLTTVNVSRRTLLYGIGQFDTSGSHLAKLAQFLITTYKIPVTKNTTYLVVLIFCYRI